MSSRLAAGGLALYALVAFWLLGRSRPPLDTLWGDEPTYVAMAESLARDGDLRFEAPDLERVATGTGGVILQRVGGAIFYSKPLLYPLLGAPLVRGLGKDGLIMLNALALAIGLGMAYGHLRSLEQGDAGGAALVLVTFTAAGALLPYLVWRMPEILEVGLVLGGLVLVRAAEPRWRVALGGLLLGLAGGLRLPNLALAAGGILALSLVRRWRSALAAAAAAVLGYALLLGVTSALIGTTNPYRAVRASFDVSTGYPVGPGAERALSRFETDDATNMAGIVPWQDWRLVPYDALYYLLGRHSGILIYLPFALPMLLHALRRRERDSCGILLGVAALVAFYLGYMRDNWFGGATCIGNRYFLPAYAALLPALPSLPSRRAVTAAWSVATLALVSALVSEARSAGRDQLSQSHTHAGVFRWLPYESTASDIDGRRDRYWSGQFLRFVDPFAEVGATSFTLASSDPAAELVVASPPGSAGPFLVNVVTDPPSVPVRLEVGELWQRRNFAVTGHALLELPRGQAWRQHSFWWPPDGVVYTVRTLRLAIRAGDDAPVSARLRWLGDGREMSRAFSVEPLAAELAPSAPAGSTVRLSLRAGNSSGHAWSSIRPFEVRTATRLWRAGDAGTPLWESPHEALESAVGPGSVLEREVAVALPLEAGRYRWVVDLVAEDVAWFGAKTGRPVGEGEIEVLPIPR